MNPRGAALAAALLLVSVAPAAAQSVSLQFGDGRVTLNARNAPLRTILAEWARVGGSTIINAEDVQGPPLTLQLDGVTEREALRVLLRNVSGYMVAPREGDVADGSAFDRIFILPTSAPVRPVATPAPASAPPPQVVFVPADPEEDPTGDVPPDGFPRTAPAVNDPEILQQRLREAAERAALLREDAEDGAGSPQNGPPAQAPGPNAVPGNPFGIIQGSPTPGVITPVPQQPPRTPARPDEDPEP